MARKSQKSDKSSEAAQKTPSAQQTTGQPGGKKPPFRFIQPQQQPPDLYADGVVGMSFTRGVVKLEMYTVVGADQENNQEVRRLAHRLVLPQAAVGELLKLLQEFGNAAKRAESMTSPQQSGTA